VYSARSKWSSRLCPNRGKDRETKLRDVSGERYAIGEARANIGRAAARVPATRAWRSSIVWWCVRVCGVLFTTLSMCCVLKKSGSYNPV